MHGRGDNETGSGMRLACGCALVIFAGIIRAPNASAAELELRIENPPTNGTVMALLFNSASTFVALRDPVTVVTLPSVGAMPGRIAGLPAGDYALVVYADANGNGRLDKNFIGIPREPLGFSNRYWPQGPPSFTRAAFRLEADETKAFDVELRSIFGKAGRLGLGAGVIAQTSPYRDSKPVRVQPIPVITYLGDRVQILGPAALCGISKWGDVGLAATASYRMGAYDDDDSAYLQGMGSRNDTLMGGLAVQADLPLGFAFSAGYEHDLLDVIGGGNGRLGVEKAFQRGPLTVSPQLTLNWLTADLADYEYGVPVDKTAEGRPAYQPGDAVSLEGGVNLFIELSGAWRIILNANVTRLPSELTASPIVDQAWVSSGFAAVNRLL